MFSFFFTVESDASHPNHDRPKEAWAWVAVVLPDPREGSEAAARDSLAAACWCAKELLDIRAIRTDEVALLPREARMVLQRHPVYAEIYSKGHDARTEGDNAPEWLRKLKATHIVPEDG